MQVKKKRRGYRDAWLIAGLIKKQSKISEEGRQDCGQVSKSNEPECEGGDRGNLICNKFIEMQKC